MTSRLAVGVAFCVPIIHWIETAKGGELDKVADTSQDEKLRTLGH